MCCVVILGSGGLLQSILDESFFSGVMAIGLGYKMEFTPVAYFTNSARGIVESGLLCGPLIAMLLINTRVQKTAKAAAITGVLVLFTQDIWLSANKVMIELYYYHGIAASNPTIWNPRMALSFYLKQSEHDLIFPLVCDVVGGPFAGILCRWLSLEVEDICILPDQRKVFTKILSNLIIGTLGAIGSFALIYFIFVKPMRQNTVLTVTKEHFATIQYGNQILPIPQIWTFPTNGILINDPSDRVVTFASSEPLLGNVVATRNCATGSDATRVAQAPLEDPGLGVFDLRDKTIGIDQGIGSISIVPGMEHGKMAILSLNSDASVSFLLNTNNGRHQIIPSGPNTLSVPVESGTAIFISTLNVKGAAHAIIEGQNPSIALAFKARDKKDEGNCHTLSFSDNPQSENYENDTAKLASDGIIIHIVDAKPSSWATLTISGILEVPDDIGLVNRNTLTKPSSTFVSYLVLDTDEGSISVGIDQRPIGSNQRVVLAGMIKLTGYDDGTVVATGDLPYVSVNGTVITKSIFWHLSSEMQVAVVTGIFTLLGMLLKRLWPQIARRLRLF